MIKKNKVMDLTLSAMFMAIGLVLPFFTGQIPQIGKMLLPMHLPILLCGLICGWQYGLIVGFFTPLFRGVLFGIPVLYPTAISMAFELATYGFTVGYLYNKSKWKCVKALYKCLIPAMLCGRIVWGFSQIILLGMGGNAFTLEMFMAGAFLNAIPGIVLQLVIIPVIMVALHRSGLVPFTKVHGATGEGIN